MEGDLHEEEGETEQIQQDISTVVARTRHIEEVPREARFEGNPHPVQSMVPLQEIHLIAVQFSEHAVSGRLVSLESSTYMQQKKSLNTC